MALSVIDVSSCHRRSLSSCAERARGVTRFDNRMGGDVSSHHTPDQGNAGSRLSLSRCERPEKEGAMSILVVGGTGFIGPRLIRRLIDRGQTVVCMDVNTVPSSPYARMPSEATVIRGDVTRFDDVMRTVLEVKPERLVNLAYGLGAGEGNPHSVMRLDVLGMDNCFEAARLAGVRRV